MTCGLAGYWRAHISYYQLVTSSTIGFWGHKRGDGLLGEDIGGSAGYQRVHMGCYKPLGVCATGFWVHECGDGLLGGDVGESAGFSARNAHELMQYFGSLCNWLLGT
jgi:hypothetical protein